MKVVLCLVGFLLAAVVHTNADDQTWPNKHKCTKKCHLVPHHKMERICAESGKEYLDRCFLDCDIQYPFDKNGDIPDEDIKEADCKPGTVGHCWIKECTEKEKTFLGRPNEPLCEKDPPHYDTRLPCSFKCMRRIFDKKEVELVPCSEVKKEETAKEYGAKEDEDCWQKCWHKRADPSIRRRMVCTESGTEHSDRCAFDCYELRDYATPGDLMETECKNGTVAHCFNTECTEEERIHFNNDDDGKLLFCDKEWPHLKVFTPCYDRCEQRIRDKIELEFIKCKDAKKGIFG